MLGTSRSARRCVATFLCCCFNLSPNSLLSSLTALSSRFLSHPPSLFLSIPPFLPLFLLPSLPFSSSFSSSQTYLPRFPNPRKRLLVGCALSRPNPKCYVCSPKPEVCNCIAPIYSTNTLNNFTMGLVIPGLGNGESSNSILRIWLL